MSIHVIGHISIDILSSVCGVVIVTFHVVVVGLVDVVLKV